MTGPGPERLDMIALACLVEPGTPGIAELVAEQGAGVVLAEVRAQRRPPGWSDASTRSRSPACWPRWPGGE